jgi:hypothetical protein
VPQLPLNIRSSIFILLRYVKAFAVDAWRKEKFLFFMNTFLYFAEPMSGQRRLRKRENSPGRKNSRMLSQRLATFKNNPEL